MKLERNRAERRSKSGVSITYKGVPYLIFAALAAGFLFGAPQMVATSSIAQVDKGTITRIERKSLFFVPAGYIGRTNSISASALVYADVSYTGSWAWVDDGNGSYRVRFLTSGTFTPAKTIVIDVFMVGGGGGGRNGVGNQDGGGGGAGGYAGTWQSITLTANQSYTVTIGAGGTANGGTGGTTSISGPGITTMSKAGGAPGAAFYYGGTGGSGGGASGGVGGSDGGNGGGNASYRGTGQGTTTREFGQADATLYAGAGGGGTLGTGGAGGAGGGGSGGGAPYSGTAYAGVAGTNNLGGGGGGGGSSTTNGAAGAAGGSGILIIRNHR